MATEQNSIETKVTLDATQAQQEIAKLNAIAADGTKTLEERVAAKNKQTKLQEKLDKDTIANLEKQTKALAGVVGKEKEYDRSLKKLNATKIKATKTNTSLIKQSNGLTKAMLAGKGSVNKLDNATGGLITSFSALAANPIILVLTGLVATLKLLKEAFTSSQEGQDKWNKSMAVFSTLIGNVMDLVADFAELLVETFSEPQLAIKKMGDSIKKNIETRIKGLLNLIPNLGKAIKKLFEGDFAEASKIAADSVGKVVTGMESVTDSINNATKALGGFIEEQKREAEIAAKIADARADADRLELGLITERAEANRKRADLLNKVEERLKYSAKERINFIKEANKVEDNITKKEIAAAKLRYEAIKEENNLSRSSLEDKKNEAEALALITNLETARLAKQKEGITKIVSFQNELTAAYQKRKAEIDSVRKAEIAEFEESIKRNEANAVLEKEKRQAEADQKAIDDQAEIDRLYDLAERDRAARDEIDLLEIDRLRASGESTFELELEFLIRKRDAEISNAELTSLEKQAIEKDYGMAINQLQMEQVAMSKEADADMLNSTIGMAAEAFGVQKEAAIAMALINAPEAITEVWKQAAKKPTLPQVLLHGAGGTAMVVAPIVKGLSNIKKVKMKGKAGGRSGSGSGGGSISMGTSTSAVSDLSANNASNIQDEAGLNNSATAAASANVQGNSSSSIVFSESSYNDFQNQVDFVEGQTTID